jgi:hypothetical protein
MSLKKAKKTGEDDNDNDNDENTPVPAPSSSPTRSAGRGVIVHRIDPDGHEAGSLFLSGECAAVEVMERPWVGGKVLTYPGVVYNATIPHLVSLALRKLAKKKPDDSEGPRKVRNLLGAMADPAPGEGIYSNPSASILLTEDEDVEGWLLTSKADPLRLLVILEREPAPGGIIAPQTPPPSGWTHIDNAAFETVQEPSFESSDDDGPVLRTKRRPHTREAYERRIEKLKGRRNRFRDHIRDLEAQMEERFPAEEDNEERDGADGGEAGA